MYFKYCFIYLFVLKHLKVVMKGFLLAFRNTCSCSAEHQSNIDEHILATATRPITEDLPKSLDDILSGKQGLWAFNPPQNISRGVVFPNAQFSARPSYQSSTGTVSCFGSRTDWVSVFSKWNYHRFSNTHLLHGGMESLNIKSPQLLGFSSRVGTQGEAELLT